jgi:FkbM family methyltransferase
MLISSLVKKILKRPFFRGQDRIFNYFFIKNYLNIGHQIVTPLNGNFKVNCDTKTWIGARIVFMGDYEAGLKEIFKTLIKPGDVVVDIGANIGFHSLYFAELVGEKGKVISFEPVAYNFASLSENIQLNAFKQIKAYNIALSDKEEEFTIEIDEKSNNPGSFNLFAKGGHTVIKCAIGDEILKDEKINFFKIDVEGYESYVIAGLLKTIEKNRPFLVFEYDADYHNKTGLPNSYIFDLLKPFNYSFFEVNRNHLIPFSLERTRSCNILAKPNPIV